MVTLDMAERIRGMRTARGYTQERLARQLGLTPAAVSKWECGQALPDITVLGPLAAALGTTTDDLLGYDPDVDEARAEEALGPAREAASRGTPLRRRGSPGRRLPPTPRAPRSPSRPPPPSWRRRRRPRTQATPGELDAAEGLARGALAEKEADAERLRGVLEGIARRRADR